MSVRLPSHQTAMYSMLISRALFWHTSQGPFHELSGTHRSAQFGGYAYIYIHCFGMYYNSSATFDTCCVSFKSKKTAYELNTCIASWIFCCSSAWSCDLRCAAVSTAAVAVAAPVAPPGRSKSADSSVEGLAAACTVPLTCARCHLVASSTMMPASSK